MHKPVKYVEKGLTVVAQGAWTVYDALNSIKPNDGFIPSWSDKPLLKSYEKIAISLMTSSPITSISSSPMKTKPEPFVGLPTRLTG